MTIKKILREPKVPIFLLTVVSTILFLLALLAFTSTQNANPILKGTEFPKNNQNSQVVLRDSQLQPTRSIEMINFFVYEPQKDNQNDNFDAVEQYTTSFFVPEISKEFVVPLGCKAWKTTAPSYVDDLGVTTDYNIVCTRNSAQSVFVVNINGLFTNGVEGGLSVNGVTGIDPMVLPNRIGLSEKINIVDTELMWNPLTTTQYMGKDGYYLWDALRSSENMPNNSLIKIDGSTVVMYAFVADVNEQKRLSADGQYVFDQLLGVLRSLSD